MKIYDKIFFLKSDLTLPENILNKNQKKLLAEKLLLKKEAFKIFKQKPTNIKLLKPSTLNRVYEFQINENLYIFKLSLTNNLYPDLSLKKETDIQKLLERNKIPYLKIFALGENFFITEKAVGTSFYQLFSQRKLQSAHLYKFGEFVGKVHEIKTKNSDWQKLFQVNLQKHLDRCYEFGIIDESQYQRIKKFYEVFNIPLKNSSLLHGDLANHNVFTRNKEVTALIDWEDSMYGDSIYDLAFYATGIYPKYSKQWSKFLKGYQTIQKLPVDYDYRFWGYFLRIALIKAIVRTKFPASNDKKLPNIKKRILFALNNLEKYE